MALKPFSFPSKAQQSRQKFLNEHMVKVEKDAIEEENGDDEQHEEKDASSSEICEWVIHCLVLHSADFDELILSAIAV